MVLVAQSTVQSIVQNMQQMGDREIYIYAQVWSFSSVLCDIFGGVSNV